MTPCSQLPRPTFVLMFALIVAAAFSLISAPAYAQAKTKPQPAAPSAPKVFKDCDVCPEMVVIPRGAFVMGSDLLPAEKPKHPVFIKKPFAMSQFEITFDNWEACLAERGCTHNPHDHNWGRGRQPIMNIDFHMAEGYAKWLSKKTGQIYRLPSEAEWEYAARAGSTTAYWFGDDEKDGKINCRNCSGAVPGHRNAPVGQYDPNPFGLYDMHGNAYEWVSDCWVPHYKGAPRDGAPRLDGNCDIRVIRGGSWYYYSRQSRSSSRAKNPAAVKSYWLSFRVVRELQ